MVAIWCFSDAMEFGPWHTYVMSVRRCACIEASGHTEWIQRTVKGEQQPVTAAAPTPSHATMNESRAFLM